MGYISTGGMYKLRKRGKESNAKYNGN